MNIQSDIAKSILVEAHQSQKSQSGTMAHSSFGRLFAEFDRTSPSENPSTDIVPSATPSGITSGINSTGNLEVSMSALTQAFPSPAAAEIAVLALPGTETPLNSNHLFAELPRTNESPNFGSASNGGTHQVQPDLNLSAGMPPIVTPLSSGGWPQVSLPLNLYRATSANQQPSLATHRTLESDQLATVKIAASSPTVDRPDSVAFLMNTGQLEAQAAGSNFPLNAPLGVAAHLPGKLNAPGYNSQRVTHSVQSSVSSSTNLVPSLSQRQTSKATSSILESPFTGKASTIADLVFEQLNHGLRNSEASSQTSPNLTTGKAGNLDANFDFMKLNHQLKGAIDRAAAKLPQSSAEGIRVNLAPDSLGRLEVQVKGEGDRLAIIFNVSNSSSREVMLSQLDRFREHLSGNLAMGINVSVDSRGEHAYQRGKSPTYHDARKVFNETTGIETPDRNYVVSQWTLAKV